MRTWRTASRIRSFGSFHGYRLTCELGASRAEVEEALGMAIYMGGGPALMYAADAIGAYDQFQKIAEMTTATA